MRTLIWARYGFANNLIYSFFLVHITMVILPRNTATFFCTLTVDKCIFATLFKQYTMDIMARPLGGTKIGEEQVKYIINNYSSKPLAQMAVFLKVSHTTVLYWVKKLRKAGIPMNPAAFSSADRVIEEVKKEMVINTLSGKEK